MKEKMNQLIKDKLFLVMLVLGLLTIVAAAGAVTIQRGSRIKDGNPYYPLEQDGQLIAEDTKPELPIAGASEAEEESSQKTAKKEDSSDKKGTGQVHETKRAGDDVKVVEPAGAGREAAQALVLDFTDTSKMGWPVEGNVLLGYSMDSTIYFPTLDQYKCNPGMVIQSDVSTPVYAPANGKVVEIGSNEEIGNFIVLDLGNEYLATCGQLKEIPVVENEYLEKGQLLGYVAEPTKYYSVEGTNVFFELAHESKPIDPLDYLE
ncbi:M23 family metallopeptidase [Lachnospiraceae bacterium 62-35]